MSDKEVFKTIPRYNDHGSSCSGHANWMLDCEYEKKEDRILISNCVDNYITDED